MCHDETTSKNLNNKVPNLPPPPAQRTRNDPSPLSPLATTFHPSTSQGVSAVASALTGITQRGSSKRSEPSLVGDLSSSTSAAHSVKSGDSSHYRTPITTNTTNTIPPIPSIVGPPAGLNQSGSFDPDKRELTALIAQLVVESTQNVTQIVTQNVTQALTTYFEKRLQAQEFAAQASQVALEKKLLEKVERIEDDQAFFRGEVQAQKKSISELRVATDKAASEVTKLAWSRPNTSLRSPPPSSSGYPSSNTFDPNPLTPPPHTIVPKPADHAQQYPVLQPLLLAPPPTYVPAHVPSDSRRFTPVNYVNVVSHRPPPSTTSTDMPQDSLSLRPPPVQLDQQYQQSSSWIENSLSLGSLAQSPHTLHSALSHSPSPSTSEYLSPVTLNPNPHRVLPQAADHVQHLLVVPSVPNRERDLLPRVTEIDHGGFVVPFRVSHNHLGAQGMCNKMPLPSSPIPAPDHSPSPQSSDEGVSHLPYPCAIASPPTPLVGHHPSGSHRASLITSSSHSLQLPTCHLLPVFRHDSSHAPSTSGRSDGPDVPVVLAVGGHYMPPQPAVLTQPFAPRPSGATGVVGPPSTSQSSRTPCVGTSPCKVMCDVCKSVHWTRSCPIRFSEDMSIYSKFMKDQGINPTYNVPVVGSLAHVPQGMNGFDEPWSNFPSLPPYESASTVYSGGGLHTK
ncbi:hypothetical protein CEUSTIGMA_g9125.t1 [Chlamydomonas eustigma]|uniref:Uncharacterized protein n=1 Tax=Chlamydomonas eustigma TaxID=1157962 RepID=A0A250XF50_9CHLO|nr:hypothetical protein CEUSTIGMA_g9125.t1 [Chlamydomonas eustigma]|eukprot:GAX81697.1 hypothetical protein CEUSTIGMA_g9125.t1 [Chlamydomonas eustigma]